MDLGSRTDEELRLRLRTLIVRLDENLKQIGPTLSAIGRDREEASELLDEMNRRGLLPRKDADPSQV